MLTPPSNSEEPTEKTLRSRIADFMPGIAQFLLWVVLTTIIAIALLTLLGPAIGSTFSNIVVGL